MNSLSLLQSKACRDHFYIPDFCQTFYFKNFDLESPPLPPSFDFDEYPYKVIKQAK